MTAFLYLLHSNWLFRLTGLKTAIACMCFSAASFHGMDDGLCVCAHASTLGSSVSVSLYVCSARLLPQQPKAIISALSVVLLLFSIVKEEFIFFFIPSFTPERHGRALELVNMGR